MYSLKPEHGQVMVISACLIAVVLVLSAVLYHLGEAIVTKMKLVNAVDIGAQAGGALLATALNTIAWLNTVHLAQMMANPLKVFDPTIPRLQKAIASASPYLAIGTAVDTAVRNGADLAVPLNFLGGCVVPDLEIRANWAGVMRDNVRKNSYFPYGKRFIILGGVKKRPKAAFLNELGKLVGRKEDDGGLVFALSESAVHGERLSQTYKASLVKLHAGGAQMAIDKLKAEYQRMFHSQKDSGQVR